MLLSLTFAFHPFSSIFIHFHPFSISQSLNLSFSPSPILQYSSAGGAHGFALKDLEKLLTVKTTDNKGTLMHYLANYLEESHPELQNWNEEMNVIHEACIVNFGEINKGIFSKKFFFFTNFFQIGHLVCFRHQRFLGKFLFDVVWCGVVFFFFSFSILATPY